MNDNEVAVKIIGDASQVAPATNLAKAQVVGLTEAINQLSAQMAQMSEKMTASMHGVDQAVEGTRREIKHLEEEEEKGFRGMISNVHEGVESFNKFKASIVEVAEVYAAAFAIERIAEWAKEIGEAAEKTQHFANTFGLTTGEVQELTGRMRLLGIPVETAGMAFQRLDRALLNARSGNKAMSATFQQLGIDINEPITQTALFNKTLEGLAGIEDVPTRIGVAMQLLGKNIQEIAPMIGLTKEQIAESSTVVEEYGVKNDDAQQKAMALAEAFNVNAVATQGFTNVLIQEFAPGLTVVVEQINEMIKEFIKSYREGGTAKTALEDFGIVAKALAATIAEVIGVLVALCEGINALAWLLTGLIVPAIDAVIAVIKVLADGFMTAGAVMQDALTLNWGAIRSDFVNGMKQMADDARTGGHNVATAFNESMKNAGGALAVADGAMSTADKIVNSLFGAGSDKKGEKPKEGGGIRDFDPTKGHEKKAPKEKDELIQHLEEQLEAKKVAWAREQDAQGTAQAFSLQTEADYWDAVLKRTDLSAKDRLQAEQKFLAARQGIKREEIAVQIEGYRQELALTGQNWAAKVQILKTEQAYIARMYGEQSSQARAAQVAVVNAEREAAKQREQIEIALGKARADLALHAVDQAEADARFRVQMGVETARQLIAQDRDFENQRFAIRRDALAREQALVDPSMDPAKFNQIAAQIEALKAAHEKRMTDITRQAALQRTQIQRTAINAVGSAWGQSLGQMLTLQRGFAATVKSLWQGLQQAIGNALGSIIQEWITRKLSALILGKAADKIAAASTIAANSAAAASGAYAATAAIPIVGPELAPAAAGAAYAGSMSWLSALSAEGGDWNVREGLYKLHEDEMVLPAWAANPLRNMVQAGTGFSGPAANDTKDGGDVHVHLHGAVITGSRELKRWAEGNAAQLSAAGKKYARDGGR